MVNSIHPKLDKSLDEIWAQVPVDYYQKGMRQNPLQMLWHSQKINSCKSVLKTLKFENCLDIGCASGYMVSEIAKVYPNAKYTGVDVYKRAIDYAKKRYPRIKFLVSSGDKLPFKDNSFDLILFYETIEHVEDPEKTLKEVKRVLKENGTLLLTMDSGNLLFRSVWFMWEKTFGKVWMGAHLHPFHHIELEQLVKKCGFKVKDKFFSFFNMEVNFVLSK